MKTIEPVRLLKLALYADAAGCLALAALQLVLTDTLAKKLSLPALLLIETGYFMVAYALVLVFLASARRVWKATVQFIVIGNVGWAIGCIALVAIASPSTAGLAFLAFHAAAVLLFAYLERAGLRASLGSASSSSLQWTA